METAVSMEVLDRKAHPRLEPFRTSENCQRERKKVKKRAQNKAA